MSQAGMPNEAYVSTAEHDAVFFADCHILRGDNARTCRSHTGVKQVWTHASQSSLRTRSNVQVHTASGVTTSRPEWGNLDPQQTCSSLLISDGTQSLTVRHSTVVAVLTHALVEG